MSAVLIGSFVAISKLCCVWVLWKRTCSSRFVCVPLQVHVYFKRFDDAEDVYRQMDRLDLAIGLRSRLGVTPAVILSASATAMSGFRQPTV